MELVAYGEADDWEVARGAFARFDIRAAPARRRGRDEDAGQHLARLQDVLAGGVGLGTGYEGRQRKLPHAGRTLQRHGRVEGDQRRRQVRGVYGVTTGAAENRQVVLVG